MSRYGGDRFRLFNEMMLAEKDLNNCENNKNSLYRGKERHRWPRDWAASWRRIRSRPRVSFRGGLGDNLAMQPSKWFACSPTDG